LTQAPIEQSNTLNAGIVGFRLKPHRTLTLLLDGEIGRADRPLYPISDRNYHALRGRIEYKARRVRLSGYPRADINTNSTSLASYAARSRQYGVDGSWAATDWFSVDAGYGKLHLGTLGTLDYFANRQEVTGDQSFYLSNIHTATLAARIAV